MRRRTKVDKCIDLLEEVINDQYFNPALMANMITTSYPPATQERLITLMKYIYTYHKEELKLEAMTGTGSGRKPNPDPKIDTSWIQHSRYSTNQYINQ